MKRTQLYSFAGASAAVKLNLSKAGSAAPAAALAASAQLESVAMELLEAAARDASDEELKEVVGTRVVDVVEAVEALRTSGATAGFDATLNALLEYFYGAADSIMGGGGDPLPDFHVGLGLASARAVSRFHTMHPARSAAPFLSTHWSCVLALRDAGADTEARALSGQCKAY